MPVLPSKGGTGKRLNVPSKRFSTKRMLRNVAANPATPGTAASTTLVKPTDSGKRKNPMAIPSRIEYGGGDYENEVCARAREGHPCGSARVSLLPRRVVGRAGPADHPVRDEIGKDGHDDESHWFTANMRQWIERHLAALKCGGVTAEISGQGVPAFMASRGKQENDVPDEAQHKKLRGDHSG